jgi:hypothetical protein
MRLKTFVLTQMSPGAGLEPHRRPTRRATPMAASGRSVPPSLRLSTGRHLSSSMSFFQLVRDRCEQYHFLAGSALRNPGQIGENPRLGND